MYEYISPFRHIEHDPDIDADDVEVLCLASYEDEDPNERAFIEWSIVLRAAVKKDAGQPAFFAIRHLAELALKMKAPTWNHNEHDLAELISQLPAGEPVKSPTTDEDRHLCDFFLDLNEHNENAVDGRYGYRNAQTRCLAERCHVTKRDLLHHADLISDYAGLGAAAAKD